MLNPILSKAFDAGAAVPAYTIIKLGANDGTAVPSAAATDALLGVSTSLPAALGERVDAILVGVAEVRYGGPVTRGDLLTSDANGKAVKAVAGAGVRTIGVAMQSGVADDVGSVLLDRATLTA